MITNIDLANFKLFRRVSIDPKLITVLIGPNGSGKSAILQALLLLKQSEDAGAALDLKGNLLEIEPGDLLSRFAEVRFQNVYLKLSGSFEMSSTDVGKPVEFEVHLGYDRQGQLSEPKRGSTSFEYRGHRFTASSPQPGDSVRVGELSCVNGRGINVVRVEYSNSLGAAGHAEVDVIDEVFNAPSAMLNAIRMVPASRSMTRQRYDLGKTSFEDIPVIEGQGQQEEDTATTLAYSRSDVEKISIYMAQVTGVGIRTDVIPPQSVKTFSVTAAGDVSLPAEGSGTNSLVRLLFELVRAQPGATVLIEEPEISLHPQAQAQLASVIADEAKTQNKQVIMTTHSELIPGRLLIEIAEGNLTPDDLAIYAFHKDENGVGSATEITINERGQTTGGLPGFFDTHMQEMDRHARALMPEH